MLFQKRFPLLLKTFNYFFVIYFDPQKDLCPYNSKSFILHMLIFIITMDAGRLLRYKRSFFLLNPLKHEMV